MSSFLGHVGRIGILLSIGSSNGLVKCRPHGHMIGQVGGQTTVEIGRTGLEVSGQMTILEGKVVILLLVHLLVDDILFGHSQRSTGATLVDLRRSSSRLDAGLQTSIISSRGGNISADDDHQPATLERRILGQRFCPLTVLGSLHEYVRS